MKKLIIIPALLAAMAMPAHAFDLKDLFGNKNAADTTAASDSNPLGALGNIISGLTATSDFKIEDLKGTWNYVSPAVTFKSDNALQKIGGSAAATALENKIKPYYERFGVTALVLTVNDDLSFEMKLRRGAIKGTLEKDPDGNLRFNFNALGKIKLGSMSAFATKSGSTLSLTFDVSKLIAIVKTVASVTNNSTLTAMTKLLESYDGLYAGFKLRHATK